jgi:hypothetical protein
LKVTPVMRGKQGKIAMLNTAARDDDPCIPARAAEIFEAVASCVAD